MELRITRAGADDWAAYADIRLRSLREVPEAYGSDYESEARFPPKVWRQRVMVAQTLLGYAGAAMPVATATGLDYVSGSTLVVALYVEPALRGRGYTHRLLDHLADLARVDDGSKLVTHVMETNTAAERSFTAYGFARTGRSFPLKRDPSRTEIELTFPL